MDFMTAVFSYNRGQLLANCVRSIELFSPETTVVVFDDMSTDSRTLAELDRIASRGHEVIVNDEVSTEAYGNQYLNLDRAVRLAGTRGFRLLHLVEDDTQFVWRNPNLAVDVASVFEAFPLAAQVTAHFWKFATKASGVLLAQRSAYRLRQAPGCGIGFVDVERLADLGFRHQSNELASTKHGASLGLELIALAYPVITRVPWPIYARHRAVRGKPTAGARPFLVKPLSETEVNRLISRDLEEPPYAEHYCIPWGWRCWQPYGWTASYRTWARTLMVVAIHRRSLKGLIPHRVGEKR